MQTNNTLADLLERIIRPLLEVLDRSGLFQTLRFTPLYRTIAALAALILIAYASALVFGGLTKRVETLRGVRVFGRLVSIGMAAMLTIAVFDDASFVLERGGDGPAVLRSNLGFLLILGLVLFMEIRFARWKGPKSPSR